MSPSATLLSGEVVTGRFAWQRSDHPTPVQTLAFLGSGASGDRARPADLRDLMLPSALAEKSAVAEREGYSKGFAQGERAGEEAARVRTDAMVQRLVHTIEEIAALRMGMLRRSERDLVRLAVAMAERIIRREIGLDRELLVAMARVAIDRLGDSVAATIHLNPTDFEATRSRVESTAGSAVKVLADPQVPRGGCIVRSAFGVIDAGIDTQIRELSRALLGESEGEADAHGSTQGD